eukprot:3504385-Pleurochrysis_carterae.AAC.1
MRRESAESKVSEPKRQRVTHSPDWEGMGGMDGMDGLDYDGSRRWRRGEGSVETRREWEFGAKELLGDGRLRREEECIRRASQSVSK